MKTLKEQKLKELTTGAIIHVDYETYEGDCYTAVFVSLGVHNEKIVCCDEWCEIPYIRRSMIEDDLTIFDPEYKSIRISKIFKPFDYEKIYDRLESNCEVELTKAEIESILGYKIKIKE